MKKVLAVLALALFIGGISVPAVAASYNAPSVISLTEEDPKKDEVEKSTTTTESTKKSSECTKSEKSESDCAKKCEDKS